MKTLALSLVVLVAAINCTAEVKVEEQVVGPAGKWVGCAVSPRGAHVAVLGLKGSRNVVLLDGVAGPTFDQLLAADGSPHIVQSRDARELTLTQNFIPVVFSDDGTHCGYFARVGDEYIAVLDGKEIGRGKCRVAGRADVGGKLSFSPESKHMYYFEVDQTHGCRLMMDGRPESWSSDLPQVIFSSDGAHWAYVGTTEDAARKKTPWGVVDGQQVKFFGQPLGFTAKGRLVSVILDEAKRLFTLLFDGKPLIQGVNVRLAWISPLGEQVAAIVQPKYDAPSVLTIDGKPVPGTENVTIENVYFSPDGKHYAAICKGTTAEFMLTDGKKGQEYRDIVSTSNPPTFTPDSSKLVYSASQAGRYFVIVNDEESEGFEYVKGLVVGGKSRIAYQTTEGMAKFDVVVDGKMLTPSRTRGLNAFAFSPDGAHYAFVCGTIGSTHLTLTVDGTDLPGVSVVQSVDLGQGNLFFLFSPDGKHIAYHGMDVTNNKPGGLWIDQKFILLGVGRMIFTPDSQHFLWFSIDSVKGRQTLYVDGQRSVNVPNSNFDTMPEGWAMAADGVLTFLTLDEGNIKRYRVTPSSDTSIANLLGNASAAEPAKADMETPTATATSPGEPAQVRRADIAAKPADAVARVKPVAPAPAKPLTWADLVNHPERWPAQTRLTTDLRFSTDILKAGTPVEVDRVSANSAHLIAPQGFGFNAEPKICDLLQAANVIWARLTPEQQSLTLQIIQQDRSLWPAKVKFLKAFDSGPQRFQAGSVWSFVNINGDKALVFEEKSGTLQLAPAGDTDLFSRARELLAMPLDQRPNRMAELLAGTTVDVDGKPVEVQSARYYVLYFASVDCPRCKIFTPKLVEQFNKSLTDRKDVVFVTFPIMDPTPSMLDYVRQNAIPWLTIATERRGEIYVKEEDEVAVGRQVKTPALVVLDRFRTVLLSTSRFPGQPLEAAEAALMQLNSVLKPGPEPPREARHEPQATPVKADTAQAMAVAEEAEANSSSQVTHSVEPTVPTSQSSAAQTAEVKFLDPAAIVNDCMLVSRDARNAIHTQLKSGVFQQHYRGQHVKYSGIVDTVKKVEGCVIFKGTGKWPANYHVQAEFAQDKLSLLDKLKKGQRLAVEADLTDFALPQLDTGVEGMFGPSRIIKLSQVTVVDQ
jgi:hypothetical protein